MDIINLPTKWIKFEDLYDIGLVNSGLKDIDPRKYNMEWP